MLNNEDNDTNVCANIIYMVLQLVGSEKGEEIWKHIFAVNLPIDYTKRQI